MTATAVKVERDCMPRQVAVEILCTSKQITNRQRKTCMQALETHYESTAQPREDRGSDILAKRCKSRTWLHLVKREKRCKVRRKLIQDAYVIVQRKLKALEEKTGKPDNKEILAILFLQRQSAALEVKAKQIEMAWDVVTDEINRRRKICSAAGVVS